MTSNKFRLALIQMAVGANKAANLKNASCLIKKAAADGAKIVALPECCNSPYGNTYFAEYAEPIPGESSDTFSHIAREHRIFLLAGSIPEREGDKLYNTCTVFNPEGNMIAKYRKTHLFDIDVPGKITFQESKTLTAGDSLVTFQTPYCKIGIGICYDIRFPELAQVYAKQDCELLIYPGAFNMTTGPAHWELLARARALDNQLYLASVAPARDESASYVAWGHTTLVNPWGEVIGKAEAKEEIIYGDIDLDYLKDVREQIPVRKQKRDALYKSS